MLLSAQWQVARHLQRQPAASCNTLLSSSFHLQCLFILYLLLNVCAVISSVTSRNRPARAQTVCCCTALGVSLTPAAALGLPACSDMADEFSHSLSRVVAAQIAEAAGFEGVQESAVDILADLLLRYLGSLCSSAHGLAELAGRSQANLADVLLALEELGVTPDDLASHIALQARRRRLWQRCSTLCRQVTPSNRGCDRLRQQQHDDARTLAPLTAPTYCSSSLLSLLLLCCSAGN